MTVAFDQRLCLGQDDGQDLLLHELLVPGVQLALRVLAQQRQTEVQVDLNIQLAGQVIVEKLIIARLILVGVDNPVGDDEFAPGVVAVPAKQGVVEVKDGKWQGSSPGLCNRLHRIKQSACICLLACGAAAIAAPASFVEQCGGYCRRIAAVIDPDGFRPNVGIILTNELGQVLWARRIGQDSWQFPQGGIQRNESPEQALYRELHEEVGLLPADVEILACTRGWLRYRLPQRLIRSHSQPVCVGQKQKWFLLRLKSEDQRVCMTRSAKPEFDGWRWVSYWYPLGQVVPFKRDVYRRAMKELAPRLLSSLPGS